MSRVTPQVIVFSYHKSGTSLLLHVMTKVCQRLGLGLANHFGLVERLDPEPDVVLLPHSLLRAPLDRPYRAIRMIRDPRDIWVSGYLYHRHCDEGWCVNTELDATPPIRWPQVDHAFAHWPEAWKRRYLERLGGRSYQRNLLDRGMADGLDFELEGYTGCTLAAMREWRLNGADALDVKLEDVMADFDGTMARIFDHFGFTPEQCDAALEVARSEDVSRMDEAAIASRPQIHSRVVSKWRDVLSAEQIAGFEAVHGDLIRDLGYATAGSTFTGLGSAADTTDVAGWFTAAEAPPLTAPREVSLSWPKWVRPPDGSAGVAAAEGGAGEDGAVRLLADGVAIRPTITAPGAYSFVVRPGVARVWLQSRRTVLADPRAPWLGAGRALGVRVSEIVVRSRDREVVIPADDPRLSTGWYDVERAGLKLWRWTSGSAELPWTGIVGPAMVTVRCTRMMECPVDGETGRGARQSAGTAN